MEDILRTTLQGSLGEPLNDPSSVHPGDILHGQLEVVNMLGRGSSACVFKCLHLTLGNLPVAVKIFPEMQSMTPLEIKRLSREIIAAHVIDHPNVTRFYDCIRDGNFVTIVSEYIEGGTLEGFKKKSTLNLTTCVSILTQVASGLQAIHSAGIIHRDLKPQNILIGKDNIARITDFGIVSLKLRENKYYLDSTQVGTTLQNDTDTLKTNQGRLVGTPFYLSPEYLDKNIVDEKLDIYAFGMIAYEMITKEMPFNAENLFDLIKSKMFSDPKEPIEIIKNCPIELNNLVMRCLHRDPTKRVQSARELLYLLQCMRGYVSNAHVIELSNSIEDEAKKEPDFIDNVIDYTFAFIDLLLTPVGFILSFFFVISIMITLGIITENTFFSRFVEAIERIFQSLVR